MMRQTQKGLPLANTVFDIIMDIDLDERFFHIYAYKPSVENFLRLGASYSSYVKEKKIKGTFINFTKNILFFIHTTYFPLFQ